MIKSSIFLVCSFIIFERATAQLSIQKVLYHEYDKSSLTKVSQNELEELIQQLQQFDIKVISVKSHADKSGDNSYNQLLSQQRNLAVLEILQHQLSSDINYLTGYFGEDSLLSLKDSDQYKNRRTEITIWYNNQDENTKTSVIKIDPYIEDVKEQRFEINLDDTVSITASEATFLKFPPGTFQNRKKEIAKGKAILLIKEYYKPGDILLSGMHSLSDAGLLQTGGMFKLLVVQQQDTMIAEMQKPVQVKMPDLNNLSATMNVFTTGHSDTALWNDSRRSFNRISGKWQWPENYPKLQDFVVDKQIPFEKWEIGRKLSDEYYTTTPIIYWGEKRKFASKQKTFAKFVSYKITKTDSTTLAVNLFEKFRNRGYKRFGTKTFDTTFLVKYSSAFYEAFLSQINYINCDRFLNYPQTTEFYVKTANFEGALILVYFKNINAFMPAEYNDGHYKVKKVPEGEEVYLIAVGKRGDEFYYGKKDFTITKKATTNLTIQKIEYDEMKKIFSTIKFEN